jgi:leucyl aminopeptidase
MIEVRRAQRAGAAAVAVGLRTGVEGRAEIDPETVPDRRLLSELSAFVTEAGCSAEAGQVRVLDRPGRRPSAVLVAGLGAGDEPGWRAAGAAVVRAASARWPVVHIQLPPGTSATSIAGLAEGAALASYRFRLTSNPEGTAPKLRRLTVAGGASEAEVQAALARAVAITDAVVLARDLTNAPSAQKSPTWFAERVAAAATRRPAVTLKVLDRAELAAGGFGGILAVGSGSPRPPVLVELAWKPRLPRGAAKPIHVVLAGKGITFDTGGISLKPLEGMALMRKDMAGAAAVCATVLGAADLGLPVRVTALAPLAENLVSGAAYRPGDVVRHFGGVTTEVQNTDAEGRLVLADALAYAVRRLSPDVVIDLATLTGAARVALGRRTAAVFAGDDDLAKALISAAAEAGESMWRLPLAEDYAGAIAGDATDLNNAPPGGAGAITAALFLREFVGDARQRWAHIDMSAPSWSESADGLLAKGATGWGVRSLLRWLATF